MTQRNKRRSRNAGVRHLHVESLEERRLLATFSVTNLGDAGTGSLRAAIGQANASSGADEIVFSGIGSTGVIGLTSGELVITDSLTINGPGQELLTIDANLQSRIFSIPLVSGDVTLAGLTLTRGRTVGAGGAITTGAVDLNIERSTISDSSTTGNFAPGGAIRSVGDLSLLHSTVSGNRTTGSNSVGGGISSQSDVSIINSTVSGNSTAGSSSSGGGIHSTGDVALGQSTLSGNTTSGSSSYGGGIHTIGDGYLYVLRSTVTDNHAFSSNSSGGGLSNSAGPMEIDHSIVAGNTAGNLHPDVASFTGSLSIGYSLIGVADGLPFSPVTNQSGTAASPLSPQIGPLADNGGTTLTHLPSFFSRVLDSGDPNIVPNFTVFDQRGAPFQRVIRTPLVNPLAARIDIGAVERQFVPASLFVVNTTADELDYGNADVSLREAINTANATTESSTITFAESLSGQTITLGGTQLEITRPVSIDASALAENVIVDADELSRVIDITAATGDFTLAGLTLTGGRTTGFIEHGAGLRSLSSGTLTIDQSTVSDNRVLGSDGKGGGVHSEQGAIVLTSSTVSGNRTTSSGGVGGGISSFQGDITLIGSTVSDNYTDGNNSSGGGIHSFGGNVTLSNSTVSGNFTTGMGSHGGGIASNRTITIANSTVAENEATYADSVGGGVWGYNDPIVISNSIIANNTAGGGSPDLSSGTGTPSVDYSLISNASASGVGAGSGVGNLLGVIPNLAALADNGGPTLTHALLAGSPGIDAGDPTIAFDPSEFDQRGAPFVRVADGDGDMNARTDMGAFEFGAGSVCSVAGDFDCSGQVGAGDLNLVLSNWGVDSDVTGIPDGWVHDLPNGIISAEELNRVLTNWGSAAAVASPVVSARSLAVDSSIEDDDRKDSKRFEENADQLFAMWA